MYLPQCFHNTFDQRFIHAQRTRILELFLFETLGIRDWTGHLHSKPNTPNTGQVRCNMNSKSHKTACSAIRGGGQKECLWCNLILLLNTTPHSLLKHCWYCDINWQKPENSATHWHLILCSWLCEEKGKQIPKHELKTVSISPSFLALGQFAYQI